MEAGKETKISTAVTQKLLENIYKNKDKINMHGIFSEPKLCVTAVSGQLGSLWTYNQTVHCISYAALISHRPLSENF